MRGSMQTVAVLVAIAVGVGLWIWFFQERMVFFPSRTLEGAPGEMGMEFEEVRLPVAEGDVVHGWFVPSEVMYPRQSRGLESVSRSKRL